MIRKSQTVKYFLKDNITCLIRNFVFFVKNQNFNPSLFLTLDNATYNWPCVKTGSLKNNPTFESDWPWLLFMVIAKHTASGNCRRWKVKGILLSEGVNDILGINVRVPILLPDMISALQHDSPMLKPITLFHYINQLFGLYSLVIWREHQLLIPIYEVAYRTG